MNHRLKLWCAMVLLVISCMGPSTTQAANEAIVLNINQAIGPATASYIERGLQSAADETAAIVIIRLDTPGGLDTSMRKIDQAVLASPVPVAAYVSPTGARAASAGTFILYASGIAAMAPDTHIGAPIPVNIGSALSLKNKIDQENLSVVEHKTINDAAANIQSLAELHQRNATWAGLAVREAISLSADNALKAHVIDIVATDIPDLLKQMNGRTVLANGVLKKLATNQLVIKEIAPDWRVQFLSIITNPNIAYILLLLGIYGLFFEFYNPGMVLPGVVGAISLLIAVYAFELLPVNYVGFALLLLGITFLVIEILISSFGVLGLGGIIAFITGSIFLLDVNIPGYHIAWSLIIMMTIFSIGFLLLAVGVSVRAICKEIVSGSEALIGAEAVVLEWSEARCRVKIHGENWLAHSIFPLHEGQRVRILKLNGLALRVEPIEKKETLTKTSKAE